MTGYPGPDKGTRADYDVAPTGQTNQAADQMRYTPPAPVPQGYPAQGVPPPPPYTVQGGQQYGGAQTSAYPQPTNGMANPLNTGVPGQQQPAGYPAAQDPNYPHHAAVINHTTNKPVPYEMHQEIYVLHSSAGMPLRCSCPQCGANIITDVRRRPGAIALLTSILCCFTCCWPCFFLPFCTPSCMARVHKCPRCHKIVAVEP